MISILFALAFQICDILEDIFIWKEANKQRTMYGHNASLIENTNLWLRTYIGAFNFGE